MSIENLFGGIADSNKNLVGTGKDPTAVGNMGNSLSRIKNAMDLPKHINANTVIQEEKQLGIVDTELALAQEIVQKRGQQLEKLTQLHSVNAQFANTTMKIDQKVREIESKHAQNVGQYRLNAAEQQAYLDGFQQVYAISAEVFE